MTKVMGLKPNTRKLVNPRKANTIARTRKTGPKVKGKPFTCHKCGGPNHFAKKY
jgi:hypothetical protein